MAVVSTMEQFARAVRDGDEIILAGSPGTQVAPQKVVQTVVKAKVQPMSKKKNHKRRRPK